jgi:chorismate--pyruvate lyase
MSGYYTQLKWRKRKQCLSDPIPAHIYRWLFDTGSLTAKIIASCSGDFRVHLISQQRTSPSPDEIRVLGLRDRSHAIIRQVILFCGERPWVYARSVIPITTLSGPLRRLAHLGNKPLGAVLFSDRSISRGEVEVTFIAQGDKNYQWTGVQGEALIWGRRSIFYKQNKKLLVSEFFLPDIQN